MKDRSKSRYFPSMIPDVIIPSPSRTWRTSESSRLASFGESGFSNRFKETRPGRFMGRESRIEGARLRIAQGLNRGIFKKANPSNVHAREHESTLMHHDTRNLSRRSIYNTFSIPHTLMRERGCKFERDTAAISKAVPMMQR